MSILVYPMLTSKTVSPAIIPGIAKALEQYILIYQMDSVVSRTSGLKINPKGQLSVRESLIVREAKAPGPPVPGSDKVRDELMDKDVDMDALLSKEEIRRLEEEKVIY